MMEPVEKPERQKLFGFITQRRSHEIAGRHVGVSRLTTDLYSMGREAARAARDPFFIRVLRVAPNISNAWFDLVMQPESLREFIIADYRADFDEEAATLETLISEFLQYTLDLNNGAPVKEQVLAILPPIERTAYSLMGMMVNARDVFEKMPREDNLRNGLTLGTLMADHLYENLVRIMTLSTSLRLGLERLEDAVSESGPMDDAERARRYRARKRRRVAFQAQVNVYEDDITLLRQFGYLTTPEIEDQEHITKELEAFLLHSFLTYSHSSRPWRDRLKKQSGRLGTLSEGVSAKRKK